MKPQKYVHTILATVTILATLFTPQLQAQHHNITLLPQCQIQIIGVSTMGTYTFNYQASLERQFSVEVQSVDSSHQEIKAPELVLRANQFSAGFYFVNRDFRKLLKTSEYPEIKVNLTSFNNTQASLSLTIAGVTKTMHFNYTLLPTNDSTCQIQSTQQILLSDFNLSPHDVSSFIDIEDQCTLVLKMSFQVKE